MNPEKETLTILLIYILFHLLNDLLSLTLHNSTIKTICIVSYKNCWNFTNAYNILSACIYWYNFSATKLLETSWRRICTWFIFLFEKNMPAILTSLRYSRSPACCFEERSPSVRSDSEFWWFSEPGLPGLVGPDHDKMLR